MVLRRILAGLFTAAIALVGVDAPVGAAIPGDPGPGHDTYQLLGGDLSSSTLAVG